MTLKFMGQEFERVEDLRKAFPAFAADDAIRAIRNGATTPMEVEVMAWRHKNRATARSRKAAQENASKARMDRLSGKAERMVKMGKKKRRKAA